MRQTTSRVPASSGTSHQSAIPASRLLTWGVGLSSAWSGTGLYLDGWAHTHELPDTFFTPWHGVIYSGFLLVALFLVATFVRKLRRHLRMPTGYGLSLFGVGLFLVGGVADLTWHTYLGIEDPAYRRRVLIQLNKGESRHSLARATYFGHEGEVRQRYREGQEEQLGDLAL